MHHLLAWSILGVSLPLLVVACGGPAKDLAQEPGSETGGQSVMPEAAGGVPGHGSGGREQQLGGGPKMSSGGAGGQMAKSGGAGGGLAASGGASGASGGEPGLGADAVAQIDALLMGSPGEVSGAVVTRIVESIGDDEAGFYIQASARGPALFVEKQASEVCDACELREGDIVVFEALTLSQSVESAPRVASLSDFRVISRDYDLSLMLQEVSEVGTLHSSPAEYESELVSASFTIARDAAGDDDAFAVFEVDTSATENEPELQLRVTQELQDELELAVGCTVSLRSTPLRRVVNRVLFQAWQPEDLTVSCPVPALTINEINADIDSNCDLVELRANEEVNTKGLVFTERGVAIVTLPELTLKRNDLIVLHLSSGSCNASGSLDESSVDGQPRESHPQNFDTAIDVYSTDGGLTRTDNVFTIEDSEGAILDAVLATDNDDDGTAAAASESAAAEVLSQAAWTNSDGSLPEGGFIDSAFTQAAAVGLRASTSVSGDSLQRLSNRDRNHEGDFQVAPSSWASLNRGQD